jgi:hypothetical protein
MPSEQVGSGTTPARTWTGLGKRCLGKRTTGNGLLRDTITVLDSLYLDFSVYHRVYHEMGFLQVRNDNRLSGQTKSPLI